MSQLILNSHRQAMKSLGSIVAQMGSDDTAAVTMGDVEGILKLSPKEQETEEVHFGFTASNDWAVVENVFAAAGEVRKTVSVSKEAFEKAQLINNGSAYVGVFNFPSLSKDEKNSTILNNEVIAIEMGTDISNLTDTINLRYDQVDKGDAIISCQSWDGTGTKPNWTKDGCETLFRDNTITCQCKHLTFFAILMDSPGAQSNLSTSDVKTLTHITYIGCGMSMFFLGVALFMHFLLSRAKTSKTTKILINLFLALFLLNLTFLSNESIAKSQNLSACRFIAGVMHYSMLSTFSWFAIQAFHLYLQLIKVFNINIQRYLLKTAIAGWSPPGLVVIVIFILNEYDFIDINTDDGASVQMCWIKNHYIHYIVNIGYYVLVFAFTFFIFIVTVHKIMHLKKMTKGTAKQQSKTKDMFTMLGLCAMLGVTWGFAFFSHGAFRIPSYYIFTVLNSFQGFFLFLYYYKSNRPIGEESPSTFTSSSGSFKPKFKLNKSKSSPSNHTQRKIHTARTTEF
ncbi:hypothetical protein MATL_G00163830 [Megalops atlanticus]|uniref:Adhesion G-protein coupled receptor G2-like n=1 Tax=Megalops atlanticus TaxID=7932 RepID=A0A9D3PR14_MEGAT|nr:hypothetical protein MATL_G00163830 [Megalops atlanticus]